jgi:hypothetical protein
MVPWKVSVLVVGKLVETLETANRDCCGIVHKTNSGLGAYSFRDPSQVYANAGRCIVLASGCGCPWKTLGAATHKQL